MTNQMEKLIILGAAGRDFHDFMTYWSVQPNVIVTCFTGTQIPGIDGRLFPSELCNNDKNDNRYPDGLMIYSENELESLIKKFDATMCALAYSDLNYDTVQSLAARVNAAGCKFIQLPPKLTQLKSTKPIVAICATRTGTGKSQTTRFIADYLKKQGNKIAVVRHPMPYDQVLLNQRCQRYEALEDLVKYKCTIEEREEYELHIEEGNLLFAGVDYEMILREAEKDADVVLWDGGNNDFSFFKPDLTICVADALREGHEEHFFPGEVNMRMADLIMINKVNSLPSLDQAMKQIDHISKLVRPGTPILLGNSVVTPEARDSSGALLDASTVDGMVRGKRVLVIDDGPTLTHGGMPFGAGFVLAKQMGAKEIVDPHPFAKGSLRGVFLKFQHLVDCLPAMGYGEEQVKDLQATVESVDCDCVVAGTPINLASVITLDKPCVRARYCLQLEDKYMGEMKTALVPFVSK
jgi:predicted GTPase